VAEEHQSPDKGPELVFRSETGLIRRVFSLLRFSLF
jgi:hypothetical protein